MSAKSKLLPPIPPGEILREEFMAPHDLTVTGLARALDVPPGRISQIARNRRAVSADTALRLARFFGTTPQFWLALQTEHDLRVARRESGPAVEKRVRPLTG